MGLFVNAITLSCATVCSLISLAVVGAEKIRPYVNSEIFLQSEPITLGGAFDDWKSGEYQGGELQYGSIWLESGVKRGDLSLGLLHRQEYIAKFSSDTADYYYDSQQHQLDAGRNYKIDLETQSFKAKGLRLQKQFDINERIQISVGGSLLNARGLQNGTLSGFSTAESSGKDQNYQANLDYYYDQDRLLDRPNVNEPSGKGYALDAKIRWQPTKEWDFDIVLKDVVGEISWDDAPYTKAILNSGNNKVVGSDGYTKITPQLKGVEGYQSSFKQKLKPKADTVIKYDADLDGYSTYVAIKHIPNKTLWGVGKETPLLNGKVSLSIWPQDKLMYLGYSRKKANVFIGLDDVDLSKVNTVWAGVEFR